MENKTESVYFRPARIYFNSGIYRDFILSETEVINLSTAVTLVDQLSESHYESFTLYVDADLPEHLRKLMFVVRLREISAVEFSDRAFTLEELQYIDYQKFQLFKEVGFLKKLKINFKKWLEKTKQKKIKPRRGRRKKGDSQQTV